MEIEAAQPIIDQDTLSKITSFINEAGIECREGTLPDPTFLPGVDIQMGCIIYDPERLKYPGDLLHEAGHLAVLLPEDRRKACGSDNLFGDIGAPAAEMAAITWSWAAMKQAGVAPEVLFHADGYRGGSESLIENFNDGRYLAVAMLQWMGMTTEPKRGVPSTDEYTYPKMRHWLRQPK